VVLFTSDGYACMPSQGEELQEQPLDVRAGLDIIQRRRVLVGAIGAVGLAAGILYWVAHPAMPTATAQVLLPSAASTATTAASAPSTAAQKAVATSPSVLGPATKSVTPPISESLLRNRVQVAAVGSNVLSVSVKDPHPAGAVALANGVARAYIAVSPQYFAGAARAELQSDQTQEQLLQGQIDQLRQEITANGATSGAGQAETGEMDTDATTQAALEATDGTLKGQISADSPVLLQAATSVNPVSRLAGPEDAAGGLLVGLVAGSAVALWKGRRDRRLRRRDDLARALGVPVLASLDAERCERAEDWNLLVDTYQPGTVDAWSLRRLFHQLDATESESPVAIRIVSFAEDEAALSVGVQMASFAAAMGISTTLLAGDHDAIETLRAACAISAQSPPPEALLSFVKPDAADASKPCSDLTITVLAIDRGRPHFEMSGRDITLLSISVGVATSDDLARLALAANDAGTRLHGIIVVNPDAHDYTSGDVPNTGLRRPAASAPLPPEEPISEPPLEVPDDSFPEVQDE
jgi:capsular polysaccharide biosynthesis protein